MAEANTYINNKNFYETVELLVGQILEGEETDWEFFTTATTQANISYSNITVARSRQDLLDCWARFKFDEIKTTFPRGRKGLRFTISF